jgi:serine/threonine protein kinase
LFDILDGPFLDDTGRVYKVRHSAWNIPLAMKQPLAPLLYLSRERITQFEQERERWANVGIHENILSYCFACEVDFAPSMFFEWAGGGSLIDLMENPVFSGNATEDSLKLVLRIAHELSSGLLFLHECGLVHGGIRPSAIFLTSSGTVKIGGIGSCAPDGRISRPANAREFCSPEQKTGGALTFLSDIYNFALTLRACMETAEIKPYFLLRDMIEDCLIENPEERFRALSGWSEEDSKEWGQDTSKENWFAGDSAVVWSEILQTIANMYEYTFGNPEFRSNGWPGEYGPAFLEFIRDNVVDKLTAVQNSQTLGDEALI